MSRALAHRVTRLEQQAHARTPPHVGRGVRRGRATLRLMLSYPGGRTAWPGAARTR